jgi:hypothetical protein
MSRIISLSGRLGSGKTELANVCIKHGFERMYFAYPLKNMLKEFFKLGSIDELNKLKTSQMGVSGKDEHTVEFFKQKLFPLSNNDEVAKILEPIVPEFTMRDWLQFIGTDVIRAHDPDWHVKNTLALLEDGKDYVFDDTRFPNEIEALIDKGAEAWYIIRNKTDNVSNHESETKLGLNSSYFNNGNIIPNDTVLDVFTGMWEDYLTNGVIRGYWQEIRERYIKFKYDIIQEVEEKVENCQIEPSKNGHYIVLKNKNNGNMDYEFDLIRIELLKKYLN